MFDIQHVRYFAQAHRPPQNALLTSRFDFVEERNSLLGGYANSNSDLSTNLCEIEDSECEGELKPLNYVGVQQTSV